MTKEEQLQNVIEKYWDTIPAVSRRVRSHARSLVTRDFGLTLLQYDVLRHIHFGDCTAAEIADSLQISRPSASLAVDQLSRKRLVFRRKDDQDRRFVNLSMSELGEELISRIFKSNRAWMAEKMNDLSAEELETLASAFSILKKSLGDSTPT